MAELPTRRADGREPWPAPADLLRDLGALAEVEAEFAALDVALRRLDDGTYWTCEACGQMIDDAVLGEAPLSRCCARCSPVRAEARGD